MYNINSVILMHLGVYLPVHIILTFSHSPILTFSQGRRRGGTWTHLAMPPPRAPSTRSTHRHHTCRHCLRCVHTLAPMGGPLPALVWLKASAKYQQLLLDQKELPSPALMNAPKTA